MCPAFLQFGAMLFIVNLLIKTDSVSTLQMQCFTGIIIELPHSDLGLSVRTHPFENVFELFHVKTSLMEPNKKNKDNYVSSQLSGALWDYNGTITSTVGL